MSKKKISSATTDDINNKYDPEPFFGLLDLYFEKNSQVLVKHQIDSYNQFIEEVIPHIIQNQENVISEKIGENKTVKYILEFDDLGVKPPMLDNDEGLMFPIDAIQKNLSYMVVYTATVTQWQIVTDMETGIVTRTIIAGPEKDIPVAKIPAMIKSKVCNLTLKPDLSRKHCKYDTGGYFIINGSEKVISSIEEAALRKILVFTKKEQNILTYYVQVRSRPYTQFVGNTQIFTIKMKKDGSIMLSIAHFKEIPIFVMMRALGLETDADIVNVILNKQRDTALLNKLSVAMNMQNNPTVSREEAMEIMMTNIKSAKIYSETNPEARAQQKKKHLVKILSQFILPHVTSNSDDPDMNMLYKGFYIGKMINKLLRCTINENREVEEHRGCDDRDSMINKTIETPGMLLAGLFEQYFKKMLNDYAKIFRTKNNVDDSKPPNIIMHIKPNTIEQGLRQALSTGTFGTRKGLAQMLSRLNYLHSLAFLRKVITPTIDTATNKLTSPRHLHMTQYGVMCPLETPEGHKVGIIKNFAMSNNVSLTMVSQESIIRKYLEGKYIKMESVEYLDHHRYTTIWFNGNYVGLTDDIIKIHNGLRELRFRGEIEKTVSLIIDFSSKDYNIRTEGGRMLRPLLTVSRNNELNFRPEMLKNVSTWDEFMIKYPYVIEFVDIEEQQNMMLATFPHFINSNRNLMNKQPLRNPAEINYINKTNRYDDNVFVRYTHCEIHPSMILGVISSNMIFPDHDPGTRGHYHYNQGKQAMGLYKTDYRERIDISYILYHSQIPIVASKARKYTNSNIFPAGENAIVAIMSYTGYNQEDSMLMDRSSIEKGFFRAQSLSKNGGTVKKNPASAQNEQFMKPTREKVDGLKDANYEKLTEEGYVKVETVIENNDIIIGMVIPVAITQENSEEKALKDNSIAFKSLVPGVIDKVIVGVNNDNYPIIKIRIRTERIPGIGDKFACYDDQTEVLTDKGWLLFKDLTKKHKVATLVDGDTLDYQRPTEIMTYDYHKDNNEMYLVESCQVNLCVTKNHRMWVAPRPVGEAENKKYRFERADEILNRRRFYQKNVSKIAWAKETAPEYEDDHVMIYDNHVTMFGDDDTNLTMELTDFLIFVGMYLAEGYRKDKWIVSFSVQKPRVRDMLARICAKYNIKLTSHIKHERDAVRKENEIDDMYVCNKIISKYIQTFSEKAINKYLPEWAWILDMEYAKDLIFGMMLGDGQWSGIIRGDLDIDCDWTECGTMQYDSSSIRLTNDFQRLCLHAGWSCNIHLKCEAGYSKKIRGKPCTTTVEAWRSTIIVGQNNPMVNKSGKKKWDKMVPYKGKTYCCTVKSGIIYVRRDKIPVWCGNSVHGQKGTVGLTPHRSDMPFTSYGLKPDIIINPNCIGRRMTIGQLIECAFSKLCAIKGVFGDATPFTGIDLHAINNALVAAGYGEWGNDVMYSGKTGQKMTNPIFIGPTFYQRLKQMVADKAHSRARGPKQMLTRQPTEGKVRSGGLRNGEMERDVMLGHGIMQMLKERTVDNSDIYHCYICDICGLFAAKKPNHAFYECRSCKNTKKISKIIIPYPFMLFLHELRTMGAIGRIRTARSIITPKGTKN